jgi:prolyl oligopeptidase
MLSNLVNSAYIVLLATSSLAYPTPPRGPDSQTFFGVTVDDPYRSLESLESPTTRTWVKREQRLSEAFLSRLSTRKRIRQDLQQLWDYHTTGDTSTFYASYEVVRRRVDHHSAKAFFVRQGTTPYHLLFDPSKMKNQMVAWSFSPRGTFFAYATASDSQNHRVWHIRTSAAMNNDLFVINRTTDMPLTWKPNESGLYYVAYPSEPEEKQYIHQTVYYHQIRKSLGKDQAVHRCTLTPRCNYSVDIARDGKHFFITEQPANQANTHIFYQSTSQRNAHERELFAGRPGIYNFVGNVNEQAYFTTTWDATRGQLIGINLISSTKISQLAPERKTWLTQCSLITSRFACLYMRDASSVLTTFDLNGGGARDVPLSRYGTVDPDSIKAGQAPHSFEFSFSSYLQPPTTYRCDAVSNTLKVISQTTVRYDPARFVTDQVFFHSKDGTRVPMFISHQRGLPHNGNIPTLLYVYGGFGVSEQPVWTPEIIELLKLGFNYAVVNARGGSEYGEAWHQAGAVLNKHHTVEDVIAAGKELIRRRYTSAAHLAVRGDSNGALIAASAVTQEPSEFGALVTREGLLDMMRYEDLPPGPFWVSEFGSKQATQSQFKALRDISPLEGLHQGATYPAMLVMTGNADTIVSPAHSYKFVASVQAAQGGTAPILLRVDEKVGHYGGEPLAKVIQELVDEDSFLLQALAKKPFPIATRLSSSYFQVTT